MSPGFRPGDLSAEVAFPGRDDDGQDATDGRTKPARRSGRDAGRQPDRKRSNGRQCTGDRAALIAQNSETISGSLAIVAGPVQLETDLIDPLDVTPDAIRAVAVDDRWDYNEPLNRIGLRVDHTGFFRRVPEEEGVAPERWFKVWEDGLMEYGQYVAARARQSGSGVQMEIPTTAIAELIHDYALLFVKILRAVRYEGEAVVMASFADLEGHRLGIGNNVWASDTTVGADNLLSRPLRGPVEELPAQVAIWTKRTMDRLFLAAGLRFDFPGIDENRLRVDGR
jgi:hypothetical protein